MKKIVITSIAILVLSTLALGQVKDVAKEVLKAYQDKNPELLKKNASGFLKNAISSSYFEDEQIQYAINAAKQWDGKLKDVRYTSAEMMGNKVDIALVHFADNKEAEDEIYVVTLSRAEQKDWVMFAKGISSEKKAEFEAMDVTLENAEKTMKVAQSKKALEKFSIEMANGDKIEDVSDKVLEKKLNELNSDNFFLILNKADDFIQAAFSGNGYSIQYNENGKQYQADEVLDKEKTLKLFKGYLHETGEWKDMTSWSEF
jgi:hypothetical protein